MPISARVLAAWLLPICKHLWFSALWKPSITACWCCIAALKFWKPTSPGQRFRATIRRDGIWQGKPKASLVTGVKNHAGRDNSGRISVRHRGGGHKKKLRLVDFKRTMSTAGVVERLEYDPNRTGYIALVRYSQGWHLVSAKVYTLSVCTLPRSTHSGWYN